MESTNKELEKMIDSLKKQNSAVKKEKEEYLNENIELGKMIDELKSRRMEADNTVEDTPVDKLYAESILDGILRRVKEKKSEDSIFELDLVDGNNAALSILPSAYPRILANSAYIEGCDNHILGKSSIAVTNGKAERNDQGKWVVTEKPQVVIS